MKSTQNPKINPHQWRRSNMNLGNELDCKYSSLSWVCPE